MSLFHVCLTGADTTSIADRLKEYIPSSQFVFQHTAENCHAEIIFGTQPSQSLTTLKKVRFLTEGTEVPPGEVVKWLPQAPLMADQLVITTLESLRFEYLYHAAKDSCLKAEERFRTSVFNSSDILTLLDATGKVIYQSASINQKMGYTENELLGKSLFDIIHPDDFLK